MQWEDNYVLDRAHGVWKRWYKNGKLKSLFYYKDGHLEGDRKKWFEDGKIAEEEHYNDGKLDGVRKTWFENGRLKAEEYYELDMPIGVWKKWNENGELIEEETYKDGFKTSVLDKPVSRDDGQYKKKRRRKSVPTMSVIGRLKSYNIDDSLKARQSITDEPIWKRKLD